MFKTKRKKRRSLTLFAFLKPKFSLSADALHGISVVSLILALVFLSLSFMGRAGEAGQQVDKVFIQAFGISKWAILVILGIMAVGIAREETKKFDSANLIGLFLFLLSLTSIFYFFNPEDGGGILGAFLAEKTMVYFGEWAAAIIFLCILLIGLLLSFDISLSRVAGVESPVVKILAVIIGLLLAPFFGDERLAQVKEQAKNGELPEPDDHYVESPGEDQAIIKEYEHEEKEDEESEDGLSRPQPISDARRDIDIWSKSGVKIDIPMSLLRSKPKKPLSGNIERNQDVIKRTMNNFGIQVTMGEVRVGPTVTQYTFKPESGIPVARIKGLCDDLAMELALHPVRIEAPIPGKALVGLEVPNQTKVTVTLKEVLNSRAFRKRSSNTMLALGRDISGQVWFDDLVKLPHLLIAGATNSGKSICLHSMIMSLIFQNDPDDLKFILIDAKQVELTVYNNIPYLISPVVTDSKRAVRALHWCLNEMDRRLESLKEADCENIQEYHKKRGIADMPYLVVVVDELGDLMGTARKETEAAVIRLGQIARAAGIHLILATQRPSVDIISGLIKANMPGRIAFSVTSAINSKTILEFSGAEKLIGHGDMLFLNQKLAKPVRIQGAYIGKDEIKAVVKHILKKAGKAKYKTEIENSYLSGQGQPKFDFETEEVGDEMLAAAKLLILETGKASASMLQSRLSIGYPRANRILDILHKQGVVGPSIQNKAREITVYSE